MDPINRSEVASEADVNCSTSSLLKWARSGHPENLVSPTALPPDARWPTLCQTFEGYSLEIQREPKSMLLAVHSGQLQAESRQSATARVGVVEVKEVIFHDHRRHQCCATLVLTKFVYSEYVTISTIVGWSPTIDQQQSKSAIACCFQHDRELEHSPCLALSELPWSMIIR